MTTASVMTVLKSHTVSKQHKERTPQGKDSLLAPHQDQKGKDSNEPASKKTTSNEPAKYM